MNTETKQASTPETKEVKALLSIETCVKAIGTAMSLGRKALHTELAVCLSIFAGANGTGKDVKAMVSDVYKKSGYGPNQYKTINRRVNAAASLYEKLGLDVVAGWVGEAKEAKMIEAVQKGLETHKFDSLDDVLEFAGKASNRDREKPKKRGRPAKVKEEVPMHKFNVERVHVEIPQTMSSAGMVKLAAKILAIARDKEQTELRKGLEAANDAVPTGIATGTGAQGPLH